MKWCPLLVFLLALIHCLVQGVKGEQLSVGAKLDWKHVLSLRSEGPAYHDWKQKTQELVRGRPFDSYDRHIPVLGLGLNNDPFSLLMRLFYSIDYPIDKIVLLTGSSVDKHVQRELDHITRHFQNVVVRQGHDTWLGVSESWNTIMMEVLDAPWVFIVSMDIEFAPGSLQRLAHHAWEDWDKNQLDQAFIEYCNDGMSGGYSAFVMSRSIISKLGMFDENIFPAYYEDSEYDLRVAIGETCMVTVLPYAHVKKLTKANGLRWGTQVYNLLSLVKWQGVIVKRPPCPHMEGGG
eukprot:gene30584-35601_t